MSRTFDLKALRTSLHRRDPARRVPRLMRRSHAQRGSSYADPNCHTNGEIDAAVKAKLDNYQHDYNKRNFLRALRR